MPFLLHVKFAFTIDFSASFPVTRIGLRSNKIKCVSVPPEKISKPEFFNVSDNIFALRPHLGLDFKVDGVPFVINFDWRPSVVLSDVGDNEVGAFGFGLQFAIN